MDWPDFTTRLSRFLRDFPERTYLIIEEAATGVYVQYAAIGTDMVAAECVSSHSKSLTKRLDQAGELRLVELGWTPYSKAEPNWSTSLELPATLADATRLAEISVAALRDVYTVASPDQLTYVAWRDPEPAQPTWDDPEDDDWDDEFADDEPAPEPPDPGENPLAIPELGLSPTRA